MTWPISTLLFSPASHSLFRSLLRSCARQSSLRTAKKLHAVVLTAGLTLSPFSFLSNSLQHAYAACREPVCARNVFDAIPHSQKDVVDWATLMGCLARSGMPLDALRLFVRMQRENFPRPDDVILVCVFNACAGLHDVRMGVQGHGCMLKLGFGGSVKACNALMDVYAKSGSMIDARRVFYGMEDRSIVSWTVILDGVIRWEGLEGGREVFDRMPEKNLVAWTIMVAAYVGSGFTREAFRLLNEMSSDQHLSLNDVALCSILGASAQSGDVAMGKWVHAYALKSMGMEMNVMVGTTLLDMYAKCGRIESALRVFESLPKRNAVAWNAMISGLGVHGRGQLALDMFLRMPYEAKPDSLTLTSVLNACSHSGLVDQGCRYFHDLSAKYGVTPEVEHYACMVDLLGRAGKFEEAVAVIRSMPMPPNEVVLGSLLGSCVAQRKIRLGERIMQKLVELDPQNTGYQVLLSNLYASEGNAEKAKSLRQVLRAKGTRKVPGISFIQVNGEFHQFCAGDKSHPRIREIYDGLDEMIRRLKLAGYIPLTSSRVGTSTNETEEEEQALFAHSEKLAVCFGLISTRAGTPLHIFKNLRICRDCHSAIKIISRIYEREIVVRDRSRFHRFGRGCCSCSDYW